MGILIETMRREGYEFQVSKPEVIFKTVNGEHCEPYENLIVDVPEAYAGSTIERLAGRKAEMKDMMTSNGRTRTGRSYSLRIGTIRGQRYILCNP